MSEWFWYGVGAAVFYGLHQVFTKLASSGVSDGVGGLIVEGTAAFSIVIYLLYLRYTGNWAQKVTSSGASYSVLTGICVGIGTVFFFLLFQKGAPVSAVPVILATGAALMAIIGIFIFKEAASWQRLVGIALSIIGLILLKK